MDGTLVATHFCWRTDGQVQELAKKVVKSDYSDTLEIQYDSLLTDYERNTVLQNVVITKQQEVIALKDKQLIEDRKLRALENKANRKIMNKTKVVCFISTVLIVLLAFTF